MNELPCEVVQDLLPSYADGLTGERTAELVRKHLKECAECEEAFRAMREPDAPAKEEDKAEIDYLKKNRKRGRVLVLASAAAVLAALLALFSIFYLIGQKAGYDAVFIDVAVDGNTLKISGSAFDPGRAVSRVDIREEVPGVITVSPRLVRNSFLFKNSFEKEYESKTKIERVVMNGMNVYSSNGVEKTFSAEMTDAVKKSWEDYYAVSDGHYTYDTTRGKPGSCTKNLADWQEALRTLGYVPANPFENDPAFEKRNCLGVDEKDPSDQTLYHSRLTWSGDRDGNIKSAELRTGYSMDGARVIYSIFPVGAKDVPGSFGEMYSIESTVDNEFPNIVRVYLIGDESIVRDAVHTRIYERLRVSDGKQLVIEKAADLKYINVYAMINGTYYTVEIIGDSEGLPEKTMENVLEKVKERLLEIA